MASTCSNCGTKLPLLRRLGGNRLCVSCAQEEERAREHARTEHTDLVTGLLIGAAPLENASETLRELSEHTGYSSAELRSIHVGAVRQHLESALDDDILTETEEERLDALTDLLGLGDGVYENELSDMFPRLYVAKANDSRLPSRTTSEHLMLKKDEVVHLELVGAGLLKEVKEREWHGRHAGFSFRVAKGVRFRTGAIRGKSVVVGSHIAIADTGTLVVTSRRTVYVGARKSMEMPHGKLLSLNVLDDSIRFHLSNRKNPPFFQLSAGLPSAVAAAINATSQ